MRPKKPETTGEGDLFRARLEQILGVQPETSNNPKDNVPAKVQRDGGAFSPGGSGPGQRDDTLVGMKKEKPEPVTQQDLERTVEKTHGGSGSSCRKTCGIEHVCRRVNKNDDEEGLMTMGRLLSLEF